MKLTSLVVVLLALLLAACSPKPTPAPALATPAPAIAAPVPVPTSNVQPVRQAQGEPVASQDTWAKVVAEARKEGKVTLYTWAFVGDIGQTVFKAFEARHGIKVEAVTGVGSVLTERIKSEQAAKRNIADTLDTSIAIVATAKSMGLLESLADIPVLQEKGVWQFNPKVDQEGIIIGAAPGILTSFVNTDLVKSGDEPKSFRDLLAPRWKGGKIGIASPVTAPAANYIYFFRKEFGLDDEYFRQLAKQEPKIGATIRDAEGAVARGETAIILATADAGLAPYIKEGAHIKPIEMEGGIVGNIVPGVALVKRAPHPNAARVFVNWLLSAEGQRVYAQAKIGLPMRNDVQDFSPPVLRMNPKRIIPMTIEAFEGASRLQSELTVARLLNIER
ncbi:MAG: extracellular solute-binding protein [Chloroflexi bacterium]|nr:extracellular solute-binding protein [Chloroflexota bacterium]